MFDEPLPIGEFRVVVDTMLQGLGRQLRTCGADVIILDNGQDHDDAGEVRPSHTYRSQLQ